MILVFLANALFASTYTIGKLLLNYQIKPVTLNAIRMIAGGIILLTISYFFVRKKPIRSPRTLFYLVKIAFFNIYISYVLEFWAMQYVSSIKTTFIYNMGPLITPFYSYLFFGERMTLKKWVGLIIGILGLLPVLVSSSPSEEVFGMIGFLSLPEFTLVLAVMAYCYGWIFVRKLIRQYHYSPITINGYIMTIGGIMSAITALFLESWQPIADPLYVISLFSALVLVGNVTASTLYIGLFKYYTITFVAFSGLTIPLFAALYGYGILGETITWHFVVSNILVFIGLYLFYQEELRQGYVLHPRKKGTV